MARTPHSYRKEIKELSRKVGECNGRIEFLEKFSVAASGKLEDAMTHILQLQGRVEHGRNVARAAIKEIEKMNRAAHLI